MHENIEALSAYVDNEVSAGERMRIDAHLASCADCSSRKRLLERASGSLQSLPPVTPTADESRRIRQGVIRQARRRSLFPGRMRPAWAGAGALALVVAGVVFGSGMLRHTGGKSTTAAGDAKPDSASTLAAAEFNTADDVRTYVERDAALKGANRISPSSAGPSRAMAPETNAPRASAAPAPAAPKAADGALGAAPADRSAQDCQLEQGKTQQGLVEPLLTRIATFAGQPAYLLVFPAPPAADGSTGRLNVYVVRRADCSLITYQNVKAP